MSNCFLYIVWTFLSVCVCVCHIVCEFAQMYKHISVYAEAYAAVSGSLLLSNWQCWHVQRMIYTTTTVSHSRNPHEKREANDGAIV